MKSTKTKASKSIIAAISFNLLILIIGICLFFWADKVTEFISILIGLLLLLSAAYYVIDYIYDRHREDADGEISKIIAAIALGLGGLFLIVQKTFIQDFISVVVGIGLAISGLTGIHNALAFKRSNPKEYLRPLIFAIICVSCGALCILGKLVIPNLMFQILGVMMAIYAIMSSIGISCTANIIKKNATSIEDLAVEAEIVDTKTKKANKKAQKAAKRTNKKSAKD